MKKIILFIALILFFDFSFVLALEELKEEPIVLENEFEKPVLLEPDDIEKSKTLTLKGLIEKDYDLNSTHGFLREHLTFKHRKGILNDTTLQFRLKNDFNRDFTQESSQYNLYQAIFGIEGNFKNDKEKYFLLLDFIPHGNENYMQQLILDAWIGTKRIPNHFISFGSSRLNVGMEGGNSTFLLPFAIRSQSARTIGNARKMGLRVEGNYKYIDYDFGGYSSDQKYHEFMPGAEGDLWVNLKPLANVKEKYGDLKLGGGIQAGERNSVDYFTTSTALRYDYKKMWFMAEYQNANGSNGGDGLIDKKRDGYNLTLAYRPTKKWEFLLRYDDFDYDKKIKNTNQKEYSAGINYYILGQGLRLIFNYVFCQSDITKDSHKVIFGTQIIL